MQMDSAVNLSAIHVKYMLQALAMYIPSAQSSLTLDAQFQNPSSSDADADAGGVSAPPKKSSWSMHMYIFFKSDTAERES